MVEKGIRGGLTQVVKRHAVANHKYLPSYDSSKKSAFLQYKLHMTFMAML